MKQLIFIIFFLFTQNVSANWISFYQSQIFEAKLLLSSVRQEGQKTRALIELKFKEKISSASTRSGSTGGAGACAAGSYPRGVLGGH